jgi:hypothetical protein
MGFICPSYNKGLFKPIKKLQKGPTAELKKWGQISKGIKTGFGC